MTSSPTRAGTVRMALGVATVALVVAVSLQLAPSTRTSYAATSVQPSGDVTAVAETDPVAQTGDAADDPAIWYNQADPSRSVVVGNNKKGSLEVYDLTGRRIQRVTGGFYGNVDIRRGFPTGRGSVDLVVTWQSGIRVFAIDPVTQLLTNITDTTSGSIPVPTGGEGLCLYRSALDSAVYAVVIARSGVVAQYQLTDADADGRIEGAVRRSWAVGSESEGCVADDQTGDLYLSEERVGIWKYAAEPTADTHRTLVDSVVAAGGQILPDAEGLTIVYQPDGAGYLLASSQAASDELNSYKVYDRQGDNEFIRSFQVVAGAVTDGCGRTDGIDALAMDLGPLFPHGLFVCQDNTNTAPSVGNQNFKFVPLERVVGLDQLLPPDTSTSTSTSTTDVAGTTTTDVADTTTTSTEPTGITTTSTTDPSTTTTTSSTTTSTTSTTGTTSTVPASTTSTTVPASTTTAPPVAEITAVGQAAANANARTHTVTIPSTVRAGDVVLLFLAINNLSTVSPPTGVGGWTQVDALATSSARSVVWRKVAGAADAGASVRVAVSDYAKGNLAVAAYRGASATAPISAWARASVPGTSHTSPTAAVARPGSWIVSYWTHKDSSTTTLIAPAGVVVRSNSTQTGAGRVVGLVADAPATSTATSAGGLVARGAADSTNAHAWTIVVARA